jgi:hypothetical protein
MHLEGGSEGELNGSRAWGGFRMMSQLPANIPHGQVTSDVLSFHAENGKRQLTLSFHVGIQFTII